jgi:hypothetical protein
VYRIWRDLGYAVDAVAAGLLARVSGPGNTALADGALTVISILPATPRIAGGRAGSVQDG